MKFAVLVSALLLALEAGGASAQKFPDLAQTPPMGWNSWNKFACDVDEVMIREIADAMVDSGMRDAGYQYINVDDCWHGPRDARGFIQADPERFPSGMKALADYVHSRGLKFGIYSDAGWKTCAGRPGSRGYEYQDALAYAEWGVDYLKYDWCNTEGLNAEGAYMTMSHALHAAGRPVILSICEWGDNRPWEWGKTIGHLWRTTGDIYNCFDCIKDHGTWKSWGVLQILDMQKPLRAHNGPGHWNDPDMLEVGNGMTPGQDRAHFSMWAMLSAPLIAGNDLRSMTSQTREILTNREVIAIGQDSLGIAAFPHLSSDGLKVWFKPLAGGDWAVAFLNRSTRPREVSFDWRRQSVNDGLSKRNADLAGTTYAVRNVWIKRDLGTTARPLVATVPGHDVLMVRLRKR